MVGGGWVGGGGVAGTSRRLLQEQAVEVLLFVLRAHLYLPHYRLVERGGGGVLVVGVDGGGGGGVVVGEEAE